MNHDTLSIRPSVIAFAALSFALKAVLILLLLAPAVIPVPTPNPSLLLALLAAVIGSTFARSALVRRLSSTERAVVQYWSITPLLILMVGGVLGALPRLVLDQLADRFHWSEATLRTLAGFTLTGALISAAIVIWVHWRQLRDSLLSTSTTPRPSAP